MAAKVVNLSGNLEFSAGHALDDYQVLIHPKNVEERSHEDSFRHFDFQTSILRTHTLEDITDTRVIECDFNRQTNMEEDRQRFAKQKQRGKKGWMANGRYKKALPGLLFSYWLLRDFCRRQTDVKL